MGRRRRGFEGFKSELRIRGRDTRHGCAALWVFSMQHSAFSRGRVVARMKGLRNLVVWQKAHLLTLTAYDITRSFPKEEVFGLISQIRRCASSIVANIAEGCGSAETPSFSGS